jgi:hypothetical protein
MGMANVKNSAPKSDDRPDEAVAPGVGHNSGDKREHLQRLITEYVHAERAAAQPGPLGDLGDLPSGERLVTLRNFTLLGSVRFVRRNPRADVALALLIWLTALADNPQAMSWISFGRLARLFKRRPDTVGEAFARLKEAGCFGGTGGTREGVSMRVWPIIGSQLFKADPHAILKAIAPAAADDRESYFRRPPTAKEIEWVRDVPLSMYSAFVSGLLARGKARSARHAEILTGMYLGSLSPVDRFCVFYAAHLEGEALFDSAALTKEHSDQAVAYLQQRFGISDGVITVDKLFEALRQFAPSIDLAGVVLATEAVRRMEYLREHIRDDAAAALPVEVEASWHPAEAA